VPLADRRPETYRNIPVLRFCMLCWGHLLQKRTTQKRTLQTAQGRDVRLNFRYNPRLESRDNSDSVALAIWIAEKRRESRPTIRIALEASQMINTYYAGVRKLCLVFSHVEVVRGRPSGGQKE
jgi:hypothetical protein